MSKSTPSEVPEPSREAGRIRELEEQNGSLQEQNGSLEEQVRILVELKDKQQADIDRLKAAIEKLLLERRGCRSEKLDPNQLLLVLEGDSDASLPPEPEPEPVEDPTPAKPRKRRKGHGRKLLPEHLPRQVVHHDLTREQKRCPCCGEEMAKIGQDCCEQLDIVPAKLRVIRHQRAKYACSKSACTVEPEATVHTAERPSDPIDRCKATPGMLAAVAVDKYADHTPLYRLQDQLARQGIHLARSTMSGWMMGLADALEPLHSAMRDAVLSTGYIHHDDTTVRRLDPGAGKCAIGRIWVAVGTGAAPYSWFDFSETRATKDRDGPLAIFEGWKGFLHADAYGGYDKLFRGSKVRGSEAWEGQDGAASNITELACWAHARRYFHTALDSAAEAASWLLSKVQMLYRVEREARGLPHAERLAMRQERSIALLDEINQWREGQDALPKSPLGQALTYLGNQWDALNVFTTHGRFEIDNNPAENALRPIAVGRKNWLFVGPGTRGGQASAIITSFTASCRALGIDPFAYLADVLARIMDHPMSQIDELLPIPWIEEHPEARYVPAHAAGRS